ncbi:hypothetical protein GE107_13425 [Cohnella sp. CFH 77786]|uniref:hypothetical protein n=1 Tax=Cohnella sp. CFH 77786 TaxID=2662265 RepID=UPI001C60A76D|nr:hypothetical protein [Cohnella sp. CFH 77786]MBW5447064.1 hypothetical protein [Cohnella sp. CFH 77786]
MFSRNGKQRLNDVFEIGLYAICAVCFVYFTKRGIYSKSFQAALIVSVLLLIRGLVKWTRTALFPSLRFSILLFITLAMLLANLFGLYGVIPHLDKIEHLLSGVILSFVGLLVLRKAIRNQEVSRIPSRIGVWFALFFSVAMAGCWEIYEFATDRLFGLNSQNGSLTDTMTDIICGTAGATGTFFYLAAKARRHPFSILNPEPSPETPKTPR